MHDLTHSTRVVDDGALPSGCPDIVSVRYARRAVIPAAMTTSAIMFGLIAVTTAYFFGQGVSWVTETRSLKPW